MMGLMIGLGIGVAVGVIGTVEWALCAAKKYERIEEEEKKAQGEEPDKREAHMVKEKAI